MPNRAMWPLSVSSDEFAFKCPLNTGHCLCVHAVPLVEAAPAMGPASAYAAEFVGQGSKAPLPRDTAFRASQAMAKILAQLSASMPPAMMPEEAVSADARCACQACYEYGRQAAMLTPAPKLLHKMNCT